MRFAYRQPDNLDFLAAASERAGAQPDPALLYATRCKTVTRDSSAVARCLAQFFEHDAHIGADDVAAVNNFSAIQYVAYPALSVAWQFHGVRVAYGRY